MEDQLIEWIVKNVDESIVPMDEGNGDALVYNLVHLALGDGKKYNYQPEQDDEIEGLMKKYGTNS